MVALWENPTIWLSQERQEDLHIFVCTVNVTQSHLCMCWCVVRVVWHVYRVALTSEYVWYALHIRVCR